MPSVPAPLVAVVGVTALATMLALDVKRVTLPGSLLTSLNLPDVPGGTWGGVLTVAVIASVESLLSAVAVDKLGMGGKTNFDRLDGQRPRAVFLTCTDSRVVPNVLTSSGPGDLFTVRNLGNLVPPPEHESESSVAALLEYAVNHLKVPSILVRGHSGCAAMHGLLANGTVAGVPGPVVAMGPTEPGGHA